MADDKAEAAPERAANKLIRSTVFGSSLPSLPEDVQRNAIVFADTLVPNALRKFLSKVNVDAGREPVSLYGWTYVPGASINGHTTRLPLYSYRGKPHLYVMTPYGDDRRLTATIPLLGNSGSYLSTVNAFAFAYGVTFRAWYMETEAGTEGRQLWAFWRDGKQMMYHPLEIGDRVRCNP